MKNFLENVQDCKEFINECNKDMQQAAYYIQDKYQNCQAGSPTGQRVFIYKYAMFIIDVDRNLCFFGDSKQLASYFNYKHGVSEGCWCDELYFVELSKATIMEYALQSTTEAIEVKD